MPIVFYAHPTNPTVLRRWDGVIQAYRPEERTWVAMPSDFKRLNPEYVVISPREAQEKVDALQMVATRALQIKVPNTAVTYRYPMAAAYPHATTLVGRAALCPAMHLLRILGLMAKKVPH